MKPPPQVPAPAAAETPPPACILVVDDQPTNIQVVSSVLGKLGHEILPASDGPAALKRITLRLPDLILMDLLIPEMDGCEVCRRLQRNPEWQDIPVIFLSASDDKDFIVRALESGAVDYLTKPFNQAELISRVRTQLALKAARDRLKQLAEDKVELLAILAHDLKNHLGGMQMSAQILHDRMARAEAEVTRSTQLAENILHSSDKLLAFVNEFLANAAVDHRVALQPARLSFADAAAAAVHQYQEAARRKQLDVRLDLPAADTAVLADSAGLNQVLDNLLSNALKFSPPGKVIAVRVHTGPAHVECRIQDEGPGFTAEDKAWMFRRYVRLSARPTGGEPSSGLGLSIVRKLVLAMKGELTCDSDPGQGATFTVRLPRAQGPC